MRIGAVPVTEIFVNGEKLPIAPEPNVQNVVIQFKKVSE